MSQRSPASRLLLPLGLAASLSLFGDLSLYAGLVTQLDVVGLTLAQTGILLSIHRMIRIPGNPLVGLLMDRTGRRPLFLAGMVLAVVSSAGYGLVTGFWPFLLTRLLWGTAWALINVGGLTMIMDISTLSTRGRLSGLYNSWMWLGYFGGPLVGGILVDRIGFRPAMLACAGFSAIGLAAALLFLPETRPDGPAPTEPARLHPWARLLGLWQNARSLLQSNPQIGRVMALYSITNFAGDGIIVSTIALILEQRQGAAIHIEGVVLGAASASGILIALRSVLAGASSPLAGRLSDGTDGRRPVMAGTLLLGISGFLILAYAQSLAAILFGVALGAISGGAALAVLAAWMGDIAPSGNQGAAMGAYATAGDIGSAIGPALAFALIPLVGLKFVYLFSALIFVLGSGLLFSRRSKKRYPTVSSEQEPYP